MNRDPYMYVYVFVIISIAHIPFNLEMHTRKLRLLTKTLLEVWSLALRLSGRHVLTQLSSTQPCTSG